MLHQLTCAGHPLNMVGTTANEQLLGWGRQQMWTVKTARMELR